MSEPRCEPKASGRGPQSGPSRGERTRNRSGQATVELALGGLLLIATVMLGLYLTEVSFLTLKVQEASAAAAWDATGRPLDDYRVKNDALAGQNYSALLAGVNTSVGAKYRDFDALGGGSNGTARVFTRGDGLTVRCMPTAPGVMTFSIPSAAVPAGLTAQLQQWYQPRGATVCQARARATAWQLPKSFADRSQGGFFTELRDDRTFQLCSTGKAVGTACPGSLSVLLGDWALDGPRGDDIVHDSVLPQSVGKQIVNGPYRQMVQSLFEVSGERYDANVPGYGASMRYASALGGQRAPGVRDGHFDRKFYLSYAGSEHDYGDMLEWDKQGMDPGCRQCHFNTAGTQPVNGNPKLSARDDWRLRRAPCFLGLGGCR